MLSTLIIDREKTHEVVINITTDKDVVAVGPESILNVNHFFTFLYEAHTSALRSGDKWV